MNLVQKLLGRITKDKKTVLVIGDALTDVWIHGRTEKCQDNCTKFVEESQCRTPGGAANAQRSLSRWPITTRLFAWAENDRPVKTRFVDNGILQVIVFRHDYELNTIERNRNEYEWARTDAIDAIQHAGTVLHAGAVLLSDYDKGFLTPEFIREVAVLCKERGIPCVADCKRTPEVYDGCILKGNEAYHLKYGRQLPINGQVVITHGNRCVFAATKFGWEGKPIGDMLLPVKCLNHVGAGDCFAAHLTLALAYEFSFREAVAVAHSAGRVYVQHAHNRPPCPDEIAADLNFTAT
jgi:bifunctional ADP-heptose synthase (sugar kinase/adenylyltransferase)